MLIYLAMIDNEEDKSKFERLYLKYRQVMFYAAKDILHDTYLAEDAVHKAFIRILHHLDNIHEPDSHKTKSFVVIITRNIAIDMYRKSKKENFISFDEYEYGPPELAVSDENIGADNEVLAAIISLPYIYASVLLLKYSQGYSDSEIAKILSIKKDNVRQRTARAKVKLKHALQERGFTFNE